MDRSLNTEKKIFCFRSNLKLFIFDIMLLIFPLFSLKENQTIQ